MSQPDPKPRDPVATAQYLAGTVATLAEEVKELRSYGRRNRKWIIFDIALTVLLTLVSIVAVYAVQSAHDANSAQLALCRAGNVARTQQITLWDHLLSLPPAKGAPPRTRAQQEQVAAFKAYINSVFQPRNCSRLGR